MKSNKSKRQYYVPSSSRNQKLLFDARGEMVKASLLSNKYVRFLLFWVLPYIVINAIIFILVCSTPKAEITVGDTDDYVSANVTFTVKSLLPVSELEVTLESSPVEYTKNGSTYTCKITQNGTFAVRTSSINGMTNTSFTDISILDDTAPSVSESSAAVSDGLLTFSISDTQSGVDFSSIYGIINEDEEQVVYPSEVDRDLGIVSMEIPSDTETIDLYFSDMVGNARTGKITITVNGLETEQSDDSDQYSDGVTESLDDTSEYEDQDTEDS